MGVYIDIEMPKSCGDCRFCGGIADTDCGPCAWCDVDGKASVADTRQDCPLVPIPPHGRLIDADALLKKCEFVCTDDDVDVRAVRYSVIEDAPTIIPASEEHTMDEFMYGQEGNPNDGSM